VRRPISAAASSPLAGTPLLDFGAARTPDFPSS
jgi:hypothetical protein